MAPRIPSVPPPPEATDEASPPESVPAPKLPPLTPLQERRILEGLPMVKQCAGEMAALFRPRVKPEEVLGPGTIALYATVRTFDPEQHPSFAVYSRHRIRGEMLKAIKLDHFPFSARIMHAMERAYDGVMGHQILDVDLFADSPEEIWDGVSKGDDAALAAAFIAALLAQQGASHEEVAVELEGQFATLCTLGDAMKKLLPLEREVVRMIYQEEMAQGDIAKSIHASLRTVERRHASALDKLRTFLVLRGVTDPRLIDL